MGNPFRLTWDDFSGGYYVGQNDSLQPKNSYTGKNINVASHDGAAVPSNLVWQAPLVAHASLTDVTVANNSFHLDNASAPGTDETIYISDSIVSNELTFTLFSFYDNAASQWYAKAVTTIGIPLFVDNANLAMYTRAVRSPSGWTAVNGQPGSLAPGFSSAYFAAGTALYSISTAGFITLHATLPISFTSGYRVAVHGARLVIAQSNELYFSAANDYTTWPTLNYITVDECLTEALISRYDDLVWVTTNAVYSIYGTLSFNAALRVISEQLDIQSFYQYYTDTPVDELDNVIYYLDQSVAPYSANIKQLYGNQKSIEAYHKIDRYMSNGYNQTMPSLVATNNSSLVAMWPKYATGQAGFTALIRKSNRRYVKLEQAPMTFTGGSVASTNYALRYSAVKDKFAQPLGFYNNVWIAQYATYRDPATAKLNKASVSFGIWQPEQINAGFLPGAPSGAGSTSTTNTATSGVLDLSPVETERPSKILRVYVEAELNLDFYAYNDFRGTAYVQATVRNEAVDDIPFTSAAPSSSSQMMVSLDINTINNMTSQYVNGVWSPTQPFTATDDRKRLSAIRVLRFDPTDSGYGYKHIISLEIAGFRIKRVWVEGETR